MSQSIMLGEPLAVYVHIPFCPSKCGYCDFNSYAMEGEIMERTTRAIIAEIERSSARGRPAKTIFFGGGTPTFIPSEQLASILDAVVRCHPLGNTARNKETRSHGEIGRPVGARALGPHQVRGHSARTEPPTYRAQVEITSEANPGTVDAEKFHAMREMGFNRISLGAQSFADDDLVRLGRVHRSGEIERAVSSARQAGFENINLDLMFALPGQSLRAWRENLKRAIALAPEHLSLYCLTLEPNTPFYKQHLRGDLIQPGDEAQVAMYEEAVRHAEAAGYAQYEISNFAKPGYQCRHNLCYWHGEEYAGYGPGAVGCLRTDSTGQTLLTRYTNLKHPDRYCEVMEACRPAAFESEVLDGAARRTEAIMLGLRLNAGLPVAAAAPDPCGLQSCIERGWLSLAGDTAVLTPAGRHFCSEVALALI